MGIQCSGTMAFAQDYNQQILDIVASMPQGGNYAQSPEAAVALSKAIQLVKGQLHVEPALANPVYCSGATYLVLATLISRLQAEGLNLDAEKLLMRFQEDGAGVWGRWNANGPGTPRLFYELGLGPNFAKWSEARPGDFMKIFYTDQIGKFERGHSVVFLGTNIRKGVTYFRYWSSNIAAGLSIKEAPVSVVYRAVFSRLENPEALENLAALPESDVYLAEMLTRASSLEEMHSMVGVKE